MDSPEIFLVGNVDLEEELQAIFSHVPISIFLTDGEAILHKANPALAGLLGREAETVIGHSSGEAFGCVHVGDHPDGCGSGPHCNDCGVRTAITDTFRTGTPHLQVETSVRYRQDGRIIDRMITLSSILVTISGRKRVLVCLEDITERKRIEMVLNHERQRFQRVLDALPHGIYIVDQQYRIEYINRTLEREYGPVGGRDCHAYFHELSNPCPWCTNQEIFRGSTVRWEHHMARNGRVYNLIDIPLRNADGTLSKMEVIQDITEQKQAEAALRESEEKNRFLAGMLHSSSQPFATSYADGRIGLVNAAFCNLVGYSVDELREIRWDSDLVPPECLKIEADMMARLVETGRSVCYEREYIHQDGRRIPVEILAHVRPGENGDPEIFYAFITDLTERKRMEMRAKELNDQLFQAQKMESVGRLAGGVAHDYNNMLGVILGYAQMALDKIDPASPVCEDLQEILGAARRSAGITRQLLAFARKQAIVPEVLDLNSTIEAMLKMLKRLIGEDIDLTWFPEAGLWPVLIDPSQVDQLLANLCVNARDAIGGAGAIAIETGMVTLDAVYCGQHAGAVPGEYVLLTVSDNGHGIKKEILDRIFEPFFTTKALDQGTGLGLATVYGIVKQNNGFVSVYSEPGNGTTFRIHLPRYNGFVARVDPKEQEQVRRGRDQTVLVVEDEAVMLRLAGRLLRDLGYRVLTANSSTEAIRLAHEHAGGIDLLISDVVMPGMNGRDLAEVLLNFQSDLKCLFMSGYAAGVVVEQGVLDEGMPFIQKPFSARDLAAKVSEVLSS